MFRAAPLHESRFLPGNEILCSPNKYDLLKRRAKNRADWHFINWTMQSFSLTHFWVAFVLINLFVLRGWEVVLSSLGRMPRLPSLWYSFEFHQDVRKLWTVTLLAHTFPHFCGSTVVYSKSYHLTCLLFWAFSLFQPWLFPRYKLISLYLHGSLQTVSLTFAQLYFLLPI